MKWLIIGVGGFLGAIARYYLSGVAQNYITKSSFALFPVGTLAVNLLGCLLLGFLHSFLLNYNEMYRWSLNIGFIGAFTTFSTFSLETLLLFENDEYFYGVVNILISCIVGLFALWLGRMIYKGIWG